MMVNAEDVDRGTLGHMVPRAYAGVRAQVLGVPPEFADELESIHFQTGVPRSWLAALCEATGWDPFFETRNVISPTYLSVRRFGIAGVWADLPEVRVPTDAVGNWTNAGWWPSRGSGFGERPSDCAGDQYRDNTQLANYRPVLTNMTFAAQQLLAAKVFIETICGELNTLALVRWMWACHWTPIDPITGEPHCDQLPPGIPNIFVTEINTWVATQTIYADIFNEPPFLVVPIAVSLSANRTLVGPGGAVTFQANVQGGSGGNSFEWTFGDGSPVETTANPTVSHTYELVGAYQARVLVRDRVNATALSAPLLITVEEGAPTGGIPWWLILGVVGAVGLFGLAKKSKRQQAQEKRQAAQKLRSQAQTARLKGNAAQATQLESQAQRLEQEATMLEQQAAQEEALQRQLQQPPGR